MKKVFARVSMAALVVSATLMISHAVGACAASPAAPAAAVVAAPAVAPAVAMPAAEAVPQDRDDRHEQHPHIRQAIRELNEAKHELQTAAHDFGGHRVEALRACDDAIHQLQLALQYDKK